jgi:Ribose 5-phosphate isomerase RpiB
VTDVYGARLTRRHNDSNILCLGGRMLGPWQITAIADVWLSTEYDGGHHDASLELIRKLEEVNMSDALWCPEERPYPDFDWDPEQKF